MRSVPSVARLHAAPPPPTLWQPRPQAAQCAASIGLLLDRHAALDTGLVTALHRTAALMLALVDRRALLQQPERFEARMLPGGRASQSQISFCTLPFPLPKAVRLACLLGRTGYAQLRSRGVLSRAQGTRSLVATPRRPARRSTATAATRPPDEPSLGTHPADRHSPARLAAAGASRWAFAAIRRRVDVTAPRHLQHLPPPVAKRASGTRHSLGRFQWPQWLSQARPLRLTRVSCAAGAAVVYSA